MSRASVQFIYDVRDVTKTVYQTRNLLRFVNNIRQISNDVQDLIKNPNMAKAFWTLIQIMRTIGSLRRLLRSLRSASREGALLGGLGSIKEMLIYDEPDTPLPPTIGFQPFMMRVSANRNQSPISIDAIDLSMIPQEFSESVQMVLERDAPNVVEDAQRILESKVINWTGKLAASIQWYPEPMGVRINAGEFYADWVEEGQRSFTGYHYMQEAADLARMRLPEQIRAELNKVINKGV